MLYSERNILQRILFSTTYLVIILSTTLLAQNDEVQTDVPALKDVYANDFYIGCLLSYAHVGFSSDPYVPGQSTVVERNGGYLIKHHMNSMSPGNNMKPQYTIDLGASASAYNAASDKDYADVHPVVKFNGNLIAQLNWAQRQGFTFRGHTLVWHSQTPGTAFFREGFSSNGARLSKEKMTQRLENYIKEIFRLIHEGWPSLLSAMDVVNEAVNDSGNDRTTDSEWYQTFGDNSYIMKAFELARKYSIEYNEPQIKLYYNDYNTHNSAKADGIVKICQPIYEAGFLDGIGMQDHDQYNSPTASQWIASYDKFEKIASEISVTELDVKPSSSNITDYVLTQQANQYAMLFKCFVERSYFSGRGKLISVSKDGLNDQWAFVQNASLWDANNQCKPAFYSVVDVGINYNKLDSLLNYTASLNESEYTQDSWSTLSQAVNDAQTNMGKNYSYATSAAEAFLNSRQTLENAITSLEKLNTYIDHLNDLPDDFVLMQNYPNPFNPTTRIDYSIPVGGFVSIKIFNTVGQEISTLFEGTKNPGEYSINFNAEGLTSGIYFCVLKASNHVSTIKLVLMK